MFFFLTGSYLYFTWMSLRCCGQITLGREAREERIEIRRKQRKSYCMEGRRGIEYELRGEEEARKTDLW